MHFSTILRSNKAKAGLDRRSFRDQLRRHLTDVDNTSNNNNSNEVIEDEINELLEENNNNTDIDMSILNTTQLEDLEIADFFTREDLGDDLAERIELGTLTRQNMQEWLREPRNNSTVGCPLGYICSTSGANDMANCTRIRIAAVIYGFGDIHAGSFCPADEVYLRNCPIGYYCPNPSTMIPCPEGYFCPHKTSKPEIPCPRCGEGEESMQRDLYGFVFLWFILIGLVMYAMVSTFRRYRKETYEEFKKKANRQLNPMLRAKVHQGEMNRIEKIRPKLFSIAQRLKQLPPHVMEDAAGRRHVDPIKFAADGKIQYNPRALFDVLDQNRDGFLNFADLQQILELNREQMVVFIRRMQELDATSIHPKQETISRNCFVSHFLFVLEETNNFGPTQQDAAVLFDTLDMDGRGYIPCASLYVSKLALFLTDPQINQMIKEFQRLEEPARAANISFFEDRGTTYFSNLFGESTRTTTRDRNTGRRRVISKDTFTKFYPTVLQHAIEAQEKVPKSSEPAGEDHETALHAATPLTGSVDLAFRDLSLTVTVGEEGNKVNVVNHVSGRIQAGTMGALMGGSGAGKTSLLNALCGRAFYGKTTGNIYVNGHEARIDDHKGVTGFVPQDDIVYADLTVKECLMYSGRFNASKEMRLSEIEDLADATLANLGLSRVADCIVGDVNRRGVSGGEKKRVNIGVELMSRPYILFLDEPTSGLDSSSALLVMQSLKNLVKKQGVTVLSVIHQPRKVIFDLFDTLVLLGVGGNMVYHGPIPAAEAYFGSLPKPYSIPKGESLADWLIDISTGMIQPDETGDSGEIEYSIEMTLSRSRMSAAEAVPPSGSNEDALEQAKLRREDLYAWWKAHYEHLRPAEMKYYAPPSPNPLPSAEPMPSFHTQLKTQVERILLLSWRNRMSKIADTFVIVLAVTLVTALEGTVELTKNHKPSIHFFILTSGNPIFLVMKFPELFYFALGKIQSNVEYAMKIGSLTAITIGLSASKAITKTRLEFFREAGSGYNIQAFFLAVNIVGFIEHSLQMLLAGAVAFWLRSGTARWYSYVFNFWVMQWMTVSWALLLSIVVPISSAVLAIGFFAVFFGLLFSGGLPPVEFENLYDEEKSILSIFSSFFSVTRYFVESMVVQEYRCLPQQTGFTVHDLTVTFPMEANSFNMVDLAGNDKSVVQRSCNGWYWSFWPAFFVGFTLRYIAAGALQACDRSKQAKKPLRAELEEIQPIYTNPLFRSMCIYFFGLLILLIISIVLLQVDRGSSGLTDPYEYLNATILAQIEELFEELSEPF